MELNNIDLTNEAIAEFDKLKEQFKIKVAVIPGTENFIDRQLQRLYNNRFTKSNLSDFQDSVPMSMLFHKLSVKQKAFYVAGWNSAENGNLDRVNKYFIEGWEETYKQGAADCLFYHWLNEQKTILKNQESVVFPTEKKPKLNSLALCYFYLHNYGKGKNLKEDISERNSIADKAGFSRDTFYKAYMTYILEPDAMIKIGNGNKQTVIAKLESLNGAIELLKTKPESEKATERALLDLERLNKKIDQIK